MTLLTADRTFVKEHDARLIIAFNGVLTVVDNVTCRRPSTLDLLTLSRPAYRIAGWHDGLEG